jgi:hypothetical protein
MVNLPDRGCTGTERTHDCDLSFLEFLLLAEALFINSMLFSELDTVMSIQQYQQSVNVSY